MCFLNPTCYMTRFNLFLEIELIHFLCVYIFYVFTTCLTPFTCFCYFLHVLMLLCHGMQYFSKIKDGYMMNEQVEQESTPRWVSVELNANDSMLYVWI